MNDYDKKVSVKLDDSGNVTFPGPNNEGGSVNLDAQQKHVDVFGEKLYYTLPDAIKFELTDDSADGSSIVGISFDVDPRSVFGAPNGNEGTNDEVLYGIISGHDLVLPDYNNVMSGEMQYSYTLWVEDSSGALHPSDPQILNDPPPG